jgi:hypothetical protein
MAAYEAAGEKVVCLLSKQLKEINESRCH